MCKNLQAVQSENKQLRDYIIQLQCRLLNYQQELPPPPSNMDGTQPGVGDLTSSLQLPATLHHWYELQAVGQTSDIMKHELPRSEYPDPTLFDMKAGQAAHSVVGICSTLVPHQCHQSSTVSGNEFAYCLKLESDLIG
jgi:hypothetical protein